MREISRSAGSSGVVGLCNDRISESLRQMREMEFRLIRVPCRHHIRRCSCQLLLCDVFMQSLASVCYVSFCFDVELTNLSHCVQQEVNLAVVMTFITSCIYRKNNGVVAFYY